MQTPAAVIERQAFAKVNLTLNVGLRDATGLHEISSIMHTISLADHVRIARTSAPGISLTVDDGAIRQGSDAVRVPASSDNLVWRAAELALQSSRAACGLAIRLIKRIPAQAGLGGGSSDAAATLLALRSLLGWRIDDSDLNSLASGIGSDVPFFLRGGAALVAGHGETVTPLPNIPTLHMVIVKPPGGVSTAVAYATLDRARQEMPGMPSGRLRRPGADSVQKALQSGAVESVAGALYNDFDTVVARLSPSSADAMRDLLAAGALMSHLCGSGSAVFGLARSTQAAEVIAGRLRAKWKETAACRTVSASEVEPS